MVVMKRLGVSLGGSATLQQVLKMKIDGAPRKREPTPESAVWQATSRKNARSGAPPVISGNVKDKPASYFVVKVAHPPERDRKLDAAKEQRKNRRQRAA
jgi:hypothetical protein